MECLELFLRPAKSIRAVMLIGIVSATAEILLLYRCEISEINRQRAVDVLKLSMVRNSAPLHVTVVLMAQTPTSYMVISHEKITKVVIVAYLLINAQTAMLRI